MKQVLVAFLFLLLVTGGFAVTPWANSSLQMRQKFVCNLNVNESQYDFPATLTFNSQNLFTKGYMRTDAKDFQFYNDSNSGLQYELLNSTNNSGATIAYVKGNYTTGIDNVVWQYMNGTAQNPFYNQTWSNHYCAVYHLETGNNSAGWTPSTALTIAFGGAVAPTYIPGKQGNALSVLQGATNYLHTPSADAYSSCQIDPQYNYSISFWFNKSSSATASIFFSLEEQAFLGYIGAPCGANSLRISPDGSNYACYSPFSQSPAYTHVLLSRNTTPSNLSLYLNGTYATSETTPVGPLSRVTAVGGGAVAALGMSGTIDEVRMRNVTDVIYSQAEYNHSCIATGLLELNGAGAINYCNVTFSFPLINVSIYDETNRSFLPANTEITLTLYNGSELYNFSANITNRQNFSLCSISNVSGWNINTFEQYNDNGTGLYNQRNYYIQNHTLQNYGGENYSRFLGTTTDTNLVNFQVYDENGIELGNATISAYRYYPANNSYVLIGEALTGSPGTANMWLTYNDVTYRFIVSKDFIILKIFADQTVGCTVGLTCSVTLNLDRAERGEFGKYAAYVKGHCTLNNVSAIVTCTYSDSSGHLQAVNLTVWNATSVNGSNLVTQNYSTTVPGTVTAYLGNMSNRTFFVYLRGSFHSAEGTEIPITNEVFDFQHVNWYGMMGTLIALIAVMVMAGIGAAFGPSGAVLGAWGGLTLSMLVGISSVGIGAVAALGITALVIIYVMRS